jgi:hypothetical protein
MARRHTRLSVVGDRSRLVVACKMLILGIMHTVQLTAYSTCTQRPSPEAGEEVLSVDRTCFDNVE